MRERSIEEQQQIDRLRARATLGERLTPDDYAAVAKDDAFSECVMLLDKIDADKQTSEVVSRLLAIIAANKIAAYGRRYALEGRVTELERAVKPKVRIKAETRPCA